MQIKSCGFCGVDIPAERRSCEDCDHLVRSRKSIPGFQRKRAKVLSRSKGLCECCKNSLAEEVDHIIPLRSGGSNKLSNLQALCKDCHAKKTREDMKPKKYSLADYLASH